MNIVVLMAGKSKRFFDAGYDVPKPLICTLAGMTILEATTRSFPFISHYPINKRQSPFVNLVFACLTKHKQYNTEEYLRAVYGDNIQIIWFDEVTRGNLETAYKTVCNSKFLDSDDLFILDCDNQYYHNNLSSAVVHELYGNRMLVCGFKDHKKIPKWANAVVDENNLVTDIFEKDAKHVDDFALVGVFGFGETRLFKRYANYILNNTGVVANGEYYMSQVPKMHALLGLPVVFHEVDDVKALGTPEELGEYNEICV